MMLAHQGDYGLVTRLSREIQVSRRSLYLWRDHAEAALRTAFAPPTAAAPQPTSPRQLLTLWINHMTDRGIQAAVQEFTAHGVSLATITALLHEAGQRAITYLQTHLPPTMRALALDEIYANDRRGAYLNVVDVHSGAVWASEGPLPVDTESWTLVLWEVQAHGLHWDRVVLDGGAAMQAACADVTPEVQLQGDSWHELYGCGQVQARLQRALTQLEQRTPAVTRQAARVAAGQAPKGRKPKTDLVAHTQDIATARRVVDGTRFLSEELRRLLAVVVLDQRGLLNAAQRQADLEALLALLRELAESAPAPQQEQLRRLHTHLVKRLPHLLTFVPQLDQVQQDLRAVLPAEHQVLLAWAWLRRKTLRWSSADLLAAIPRDWRSAARVLLAAWDDAVWVSSAVERYHSILRPHLSVHRTLSTEMLALIAVWHNHRVFTRGIHKGKNPLQLSGITDAPTDWLVALGYSPDEAHTPPTPTTAEVALAA
ncbi:MAG: hypothetical protein WCF99_00730 [Chloroflexales bacterium]